MKKRLKKKIERKDMSNRQLVKFLNGVVLRQDKRIENQKSKINLSAEKILALVNENINLEKQNMAMSIQSIRISEEVKFLNQEINELRVEKANKWWKKAIRLGV